VFQTAFERYTQNVQKPFDAGSQRILSIRTAFIKNSFKNDIPARMWLEFWKLFIPAGSISFLLSVTEPLLQIHKSSTVWSQDSRNTLHPEAKVKVTWIYIAPYRETSKVLWYGSSHSFTCKQHHPCLYLVSIHQMAPPLSVVADI